LAWALVVLPTASHPGPLTAALFVLYPLIDVAATAVDVRASRARGASGRSLSGLCTNVVISTLAAVALAVAATSGTPAVLRAWGAWAVAAGLVQLVNAVRRRRVGGQWPQVLSGGLSTLAGASFIAAASAATPSLASAAGYAVPGAVFFLVSALRLRRTARTR
ncbi:hypothetical protein GTQ99_21690, partial [Kineococcus sp. T13]|uniref:DUF308 domain-containing protein n=1 Tax=Kineococcus vitellinus TaxID=2696565 RepID=UPI001412ACAC